MTSDLTQRLKRELWLRYGTAAHPAEWDGVYMAGGHISQRFWEYFITIEMLGLTEESTVIDIGGGNNIEGGAGFFSRVLASAGVKVVVVDRCEPVVPVENVVIENCFADRETLGSLIRKYNPTHISCVSVLEHASEDQQRGIFHAIEDEFRGEKAVFTFEFHETECHFEQQLTTESLSNAVSVLQRYYLERMERTPLHCVNAVQRWYPLALQFGRPADR